MNRMLIAGIGSIFFADDAFAVEVVRRLSLRRWPEYVDIVDFGSRAYDLSYALSQGYHSVILVDSMVPRGRVPGSVYLIQRRAGDRENGVRDGHAPGSDSIFRLAQSAGGESRRIVLVGLEPPVQSESSDAGWNDPLRNAVPQAVEMVEAMAEELMRDLPPQPRQPENGSNRLVLGSQPGSVPPP